VPLCVGISGHQFFSDSRSLAIDLVGRGSKPSQHRFCHRERDLALTGKDLLGARVAQGRNVSKILAADEDVRGRIDGSRALDDAR